MKVKKKVADDESNKIRNMFFHIRRGWYRKSIAKWMDAYPKPDRQVDQSPGFKEPDAALPALPAACGAALLALPAAACGAALPAACGAALEAPPSKKAKVIKQLLRVPSSVSSHLESEDEETDAPSPKLGSIACGSEIVLSDDEVSGGERLEVDQIIDFNGVDASRQMWIGDDLVWQDKPLALHAPTHVGECYIAEWADGERNEVPGFLYLGDIPQPADQDNGGGEEDGAEHGEEEEPVGDDIVEEFDMDDIALLIDASPRAGNFVLVRGTDLGQAVGKVIRVVACEGGDKLDVEAIHDTTGTCHMQVLVSNTRVINTAALAEQGEALRACLMSLVWSRLIGTAKVTVKAKRQGSRVPIVSMMCKNEGGKEVQLTQVTTSNHHIFHAFRALVGVVVNTNNATELVKATVNTMRDNELRVTAGYMG